jgi:hypothetical protein
MTRYEDKRKWSGWRRAHFKYRFIKGELQWAFHTPRLPENIIEALEKTVARQGAWQEVRAGVQNGASAGGKARAAKHHSEHSKWQKAAEAIWAQRPKLTRRDVARIINTHLRLGLSAKHIERYIHKP